jgi:hypothetical protein
MRFFPKDLKPFKIQTKFKFELFPRFLIQNPERKVVPCYLTDHLKKFWEF